MASDGPTGVWTGTYIIQQDLEVLAFKTNMEEYNKLFHKPLHGNLKDLLTKCKYRQT